MKTVELADGGLLLIAERFLPPDVADRAFATLRDGVAWEQKRAPFGDPGITYRYSGTENRALPWNDTLRELRDRIQEIRGRYNYCLLNRYRDGKDSVGWHADDEPGLGPEIGSLSLGATREFRIRHNTTGETHRFALHHGTLLLMAGTMQQHWKHSVPKTTAAVGERVNVTYRWIQRDDEFAQCHHALNSPPSGLSPG